MTDMLWTHARQPLTRASSEPVDHACQLVPAHTAYHVYRLGAHAASMAAATVGPGAFPSCFEVCQVLHEAGPLYRSSSLSHLLPSVCWAVQPSCRKSRIRVAARHKATQWVRQPDSRPLFCRTLSNTPSCSSAHFDVCTLCMLSAGTCALQYLLLFMPVWCKQVFLHADQTQANRPTHASFHPIHTTPEPPPPSYAQCCAAIAH